MGSSCSSPVVFELPREKLRIMGASLTVQADDGLKNLRRYAPTRSEVRQGWSVYVEVLGDALLIGATDVAATHEAILFRIISAYFGPSMRNRWCQMTLADMLTL
jgi:hypothetical protein